MFSCSSNFKVSVIKCPLKYWCWLENGVAPGYFGSYFGIVVYPSACLLFHREKTILCGWMQTSYESKCLSHSILLSCLSPAFLLWAVSIHSLSSELCWGMGCGTLCFPRAGSPPRMFRGADPLKGNRRAEVKPDPCVTVICEVRTTKNKNEKWLILIADGVARCLVSKWNQL